jgi:hypothetical protein
MDLSKCRLGYSIAAGDITLFAGKLKFHGDKSITITQAVFALSGDQWFYIHHVRGSSSAAWASAGAEPGVSITDVDIPVYEFSGTTLVQICHLGDFNFDLPLA